VINAFVDTHSGLERINHFLYNQSWHLNSLPDLEFLGLNLAAKPSEFAQAGAVLLLIPVLTGIFQFILSQMMAPKPVKEYPSDSPKERKEKEQNTDMNAELQNQMAFMLPAMIAFFSFSFPVGLSLYWNVLNIISIWQQYLVGGWGKLEDTLAIVRNKIKK
jgi:YidC/Oxa1 family membrane protein insertase